MRRGQSSFEFLVTYGWAIVVVLIIIGILAYFGAFNPGQYIPEKCDFGPQLECVDSVVNAQGYVLLIVQNNFGDAINITGVSSFDVTVADALSNVSMRISNGRKDTLRIKVNEGFAPKERAQVNFKIFFRRDYPGAPFHNISGRVLRRACSAVYVPGPPGQGSIPC